MTPTPWRPCFFTDSNHFRTQPSYLENTYWTTHVTSRVLTCFHYIHIRPGGHVFSPIGTIFELVRDINQTNVLTTNTARPLAAIMFELSRGINGTNVLTKFHEDQTINVASGVFTMQMLTQDGRRTKGDHKSST
ncbi:hypothetical protein DPMN_041246 [Dreissena polymorpha]|uniref:Uncharacterized protein n=1 Tax=Dreissena polymorpha TaxID=45954 RepID=A0A9D4HW16_DREPO|nr:hypothetical protein DPMN_041246 [Dreissena polymorpha]